jgi:hypothetical protein
MIWTVAIAGVPIAYLGIWLDIPILMWTGVVLAIPLFVIVLPVCIFILVANLTYPLWIPFYRLVIRRHGAPFHSGDWVRIMRGPYRNQVARVYKVWSDRDQVRLELGEKEKEDVTDVFSFLQIRRTEWSEKSPPPCSESASKEI